MTTQIYHSLLTIIFFVRRCSRVVDARLTQYALEKHTGLGNLPGPLGFLYVLSRNTYGFCLVTHIFPRLNYVLNCILHRIYCNYISKRFFPPNPRTFPISVVGRASTVRATSRIHAIRVSLSETLDFYVLQPAYIIGYVTRLQTPIFLKRFGDGRCDVWRFHVDYSDNDKTNVE